MNEFFSMGGYAGYVWPSYAVTALVLALAIFLSVRAHNRAAAELGRLERQQKEHAS
jgi:heme exporter protein D